MPQVTLSNGQTLEFPDTMSQDQIKTAIQTKYKPSELNVPEDQTVSESQFKPASEFPEAAPKESPGFMKSLDIIATGAAKGSLEFSGRLMSYAESLATGKKAQFVPDVYKALEERQAEQQEKYHGAGLLGALGSASTEIASTAVPLGAGINLVSKGAKAIAYGVPQGIKALGKLGQSSLITKGVPKGFKKISEYGTAGAGGTALFGALEGARFDPENPDELYSGEQAVEAMHSPVAPLAAMGGHFLGKYGSRAMELQEAKKTIPNIRNVDLKDPGVGRTLNQIAFSSIPNLTGFGKLPNMQGEMKETLYNYINKLSGDISAKYSKDYKKVAGQEFHKALQGLKKGEEEIWNKVPKNAIVPDTQGVKDEVISAIDELKSNTPLDPKLLKVFEHKIRKSSFTVEDVKNLQSKMGDFIHRLGKHDDAALMRGTEESPGVIDNLIKIKENLLGKIGEGLSEADKEALVAARKYSSELYNTLGESKKIKDALYSELDARNVIKSIMGEAEALDKAKSLGLMTDKGVKATWAASLAKALESSPGPTHGSVNLKSFLNKTAEHTNLPELMGTETYKSYQGIVKHLDAIEESGRHRLPMWAAGIGLSAAGAGVATGTATVPIIAGAIGYNALASIANRSPIKTLLGMIGDKTRKLSPSTYEYLSTKLDSLLTRAGYFFTQDGILDKQEDK